MYLGSSPKRSRFWCALHEGTQISRRPLDGTQMAPQARMGYRRLGAPHSQEETHMSGVPSKAGSGTRIKAVPLQPGEDPGTIWEF